MKKILLALAVISSTVFGATLNEIKESGVIKIGVRKDLSPFSRVVEGKNEGFEVELAKALTKDIFGESVKVEFVEINAKDRIPMLESGEIDLAIASFVKNEARAKEVDFSNPYLSTTQVALTRKSDNIKEISDLKGKKVLIIKGTTSGEFLQKEASNLSITPVECGSVKECFMGLRNGDGDAYMHIITLISHLPFFDSSLEVSIKQIGEPELISVGVQKGNSDLLNSVNDSLAKLKKGDFFDKLYDDTFDNFYRGNVDLRHLLIKE